MKKTSMGLAVLSVGIWTAVAAPAHANVIGKFLKQVPQPRALSEANMLPNCTNFSGTWVGRCVNSDGSTDENQKTVLRQTDCASIEADGTELNIGGTTNFGGTSFTDGTVFDVSLAQRWNSSRTVVTGLINYTFQSQQHGGMMANGEVTMTLEDGRLHEVSRFRDGISSEGTPVALISSDCVYQKAP